MYCFISSQQKGLQGLFQEDAEEDDHQAVLTWEGFHTRGILLVYNL